MVTLHNYPFFQEDERIIMPVSGIGQNESSGRASGMAINYQELIINKIKNEEFH